MAQRTTAGQRHYAKALGVSFSDGTTREELSESIERGKAKRKGKPNRAQLKLARQFGLPIPGDANGYDATDILFEFLNVRAWVYSVCRHLIGAKWSRYAQSGLPDDVINKIAKWMTERVTEVGKIHKTFGSASKTDAIDGDVWYRMGSRIAASEAYQVVAESVQVQMGESLKKAAKRVAKSPSRNQSSRSGCLLVLVVIVAFLLTMAVCLPKYDILPVR